MAGVVMGRFFFFAQATILSNFFEHGFGSSSHLRNNNHDESHHIEVVETEKHPSVVPDSILPTKESDRIINLPGLDETEDLGFQQYSGYLTVNEHHKRNIFYWYVESQNNPETDPVILWTNGGPGCSGFLGLGTEHGPFFISESGQLTPNPFSWNLVANMLYIEQPAGVGFSYSEREQDYRTGDNQAAADNYNVVRQFLKRFPERQVNDFYISSESYGGHYMPQLTKEILKRNTDGLINFKGVMVGNPYVDPYTNTITQFQAWYNHGLVPWPLYSNYVDHCHNPKTYFDGKCQNYMEQMYQELAKGINPYGLDYPMCLEDIRHDHVKRHLGVTPDGSTKSPSSVSLTGNQRVGISTISPQISKLMNETANAMAKYSDYDFLGGSSRHSPPFLPPQDHYHACADEHLESYLNRDDVVRAIHANPVTLPWKGCSEKVKYSRKDTTIPQINLYKEILHEMTNPKNNVNLRMLIFSGDDDSVCSLAGTQSWIWDLGFRAKTRHSWQAWKVKNQTAGFVTQFHLDNYRSSFTFATVHGAGHEVPAYRPMEALELLRNYLRGKW